MAGHAEHHVTEQVLETPRLVLRPTTDRAANALHTLFISPAIRRFLWDDRVIPQDETRDIIAESCRLFANEGYGLWLVTLRQTGHATIGFTGLWRFRDPPELELLFGIAEEWWGHGIAAEAARAVIAYAFDTLGFTHINASTDAPNTASIRVLEKLGMRQTRRAIVGGLDTVFCTLTASTFTKCAPPQS